VNAIHRPIENGPTEFSGGIGELKDRFVFQEEELAKLQNSLKDIP
jgi:hypothetical protein